MSETVKVTAHGLVPGHGGKSAKSRREGETKTNETVGARSASRGHADRAPEPGPAPAAGTSEIWQVRLDAGSAAELHEVAAVLGLPDARSDLLRAGLRLLKQRAAEEAMAQSVDAFYAGAEIPLPAGVRRSRRRPADD